MKKLLSRLLCLISVIGGCLLLAGCDYGGTVDTTLNLNSDESGVRVINVKLDNSVIEEYFAGTKEDIDTIAKENCPKELSYSFATDADDNSVMTFELEFSSESDYNSKLAKLSDDGATSTYTIEGSTWYSKVEISEDFDSIALLGWLSDAIVESGLIDADKAEYIFTRGDTQLYVDGIEISNYFYSGQISTNKTDTVRISQIELYTEINTDLTINRTYKFSVGSKLSDVKKTEIEAYFSAKAPAGATVTVEDAEYSVDFCVTQNNLTSDGINTLNAALFEGASMDTTSSEAVFTLGYTNKETFSVAEFFQGEPYSSCCIAHLMKAPEDCKVYSYDYGFESNVWHNDDYVRVYNNYIYEPFEASFNYGAFKEIQMNAFESNTKLLSDKNFEKTIIFTPADNISENIGDVVVNKLNNIVVNSTSYADENFVPSVYFSDAGDFVIEVKGSGDDIATMETALSGTKAVLSYGENNRFMSLTSDIAVCDRFKYDACALFTGDAEIIRTVDLGSLSKVKDSYAGDDVNDKVKGHAVEIKGNGLAEVTVTGYSYNILNCIAAALAVVGVICILIALVTALIKGAKNAPKKVKAPKAAPAAASTAPVADATSVERCPVCNEVKKGEGKFCFSCGHKF